MTAQGYAPSETIEPGRPGRHASGMDSLPPPLAFFLLLVSGWVNRHQQNVIDYLREENRVLRAVRGSRLRLTDDQRRRLAVKGKVVRLEFVVRRQPGAGRGP